VRSSCAIGGPKTFYHRRFIRLSDLRGIRTETGIAYRAAVKRELDWQDLRAAIAALATMAGIDQGAGAELRLSELEERVAEIKANGHAKQQAVVRQ
jgi:hypothetical protein